MVSAYLQSRFRSLFRQVIWALIFFVLPVVFAQAQVYLVNEDFSSATDSIPPGSWLNYNQDGGPDGFKWRFDNVGNLPLEYPVSGRAAILNTALLGNVSGNQRASLESPFLDCSASPNILLFFHQQFEPGISGKGYVEINSDTGWTVQTTFSTGSSGVVQEIINISALSGSRDSVKIRFTWQGDSTGYWVIDNFKILIPSPRDLNLVNLDSPLMPFDAGVQPVKIRIFNEGLETITNAKMNWEVNGIGQAPFNWTGSLPFGEKSAEIEIGSYLFNPGMINTFRIWVSRPNNGTDYNRFNDTIRVRLGASMCGTYTIGGTNPDFQNFTEAVFALNNASISCPVTFKVRPGLYQEQLSFSGITGSSPINTITFEPSNGDSTSVTLLNEEGNPSRDFTISLSGSRNLIFRKISILRNNGVGAVVFQDGVSGFTLQSCKVGNILSKSGACDSNIVISNSNTGYVQISGTSGSEGIHIINNRININSSVGGVFSGIEVRACNAPKITNNILKVQSIQNFAGANTEAYGLQLIECPMSKIEKNVVACSTASHYSSRTNQSIGFKIEKSPESSLFENNFTVASRIGFSASYALISDSASKGLKIINNVFSIAGITVNQLGQSIATGLLVRPVKSSILNNQIKLSTSSSIPLTYGIKVEDDSAQISGNTISDCFTGIEVSGENNILSNNIITTITGSGIYLRQGNYHSVLQNKVTGVKEGSACVISAPNCLVYNNFFQTGGNALSVGVKVDSTAYNTSLYFNSINSAGTDQFGNTSLSFSGAANSKIQNNIFCNSGQGSAITVKDQGSGINWNNNCYYSFTGLLLYNNANPFYSLQDFGVQIGGNTNSISVNPYFNSITDLTPGHIALNGKASPIAIVSNDISGNARGVLPDIGALEFEPCSPDAGIDRFVGLESPIPAGIRPIKVILQNQGLIPLTSLSINWSVNGVAQVPYQWNGFLDSGSVEIQIGTFNFISGVTAKILAFTSLTNDCKSRNDTIRSGSLASALCGTYQIGGNNADFDSFVEAVSALSLAGITCPVVFKVANGIYNEQVRIPVIPGSSSINTITFESLSGDSSKATLEYSEINAANDFSLNLRGTDFVIFRKIGIRRKNGTVAILLSDGNHHLDFISSSLGNVLSTGLYVDSSISFFSCRTGFLRLNGKTGLNSTSISIVSNNIYSDLIDFSEHYGIYITNSDSPLIYRNTISASAKSVGSNPNCRSESVNGIATMNTPGILVSENSVQVQSSFFYGTCYQEAVGLKIENSPNSKFLNNNFLVTSTSSNANSFGIILKGSNNDFKLSDNEFNLSAIVNGVTGLTSINGIISTSSGKGMISGNQISIRPGSQNGNFGISFTGDSVQVFKNIVSDFSTGIDSRASSTILSYNKLIRISSNGIILSSGSNPVILNNRLFYIQGNGIVSQVPGTLIANNCIYTEGNVPTRGIWLKSTSTNAKIVYNSINANGMDIQTSYALDVETGSGSILRNNIFSNYGKGSAFRIVNKASFLNWSNNCFYSRLSALGENGTQSLWSLAQIQGALGQNNFSFSVNPYFSGDTSFIVYQSQLDAGGSQVAEVLIDINNQVRNNPSDIGAREFTPCQVDLGVNRIDGSQAPVSSGLQPINVELQNHGLQKAESATIFWQVNGISQIPFYWSGNLQGKSNLMVQIGNFYFLPGRSYVIQAWAKTNDGRIDCNPANDTTQSRSLVTYLCGVFTIGGSNPDFLTISDAVSALNVTGVSCPVVFKIRNGVYKEQAELGNVQGVNALNTVTFESESLDSSLVLIQYESEDASRDFTFGLNGSSYINFNRVGLNRKKGNYSVNISGNAHHLNFSNCNIGNIFSPGTSSDSIITFLNNQIGSLYLQASSSTRSKGIKIIGNKFNFSQNAGPSAYALFISGSSNLEISGNNIISKYLLSQSGSSISSYGLFLRNCIGGNVVNNQVKAVSKSSFPNTENVAVGAGLSQCSGLNFSFNSLKSVSSTGFPRSIGVNIENGSSNNQITDNYFDISTIAVLGSSGNSNRGISISSGSNNLISGNSIVPNDSAGSGYIFYGIYNSGIGSTISQNNIRKCNVGIDGQGPFATIFNNDIFDIKGNGLNISGGASQNISNNRIFRLNGGVGIILKSPVARLFNNAIQTYGPGVSKGIVIQEGADNAVIVFNSVKAEGSDVDLSVPFEYQASSNTILKNNIFANYGMGNAIQVASIPSQKDWDYNCFYSAGSNFARLDGLNFSQLSSWGQTISSDANSKILNPFFQADTLLVPNQPQINGAGIPVAGITQDIEGRSRSSLAPDIGAYEFSRDFGLSTLISPTLACLKTNVESVVVRVVSGGNVPGSNLRIAYSVNNGNIIIDTISTVLSRSLDFAFEETTDLSADGTYNFKVWLVDNLDENPANDTLYAVRYSKPSPILTLDYIASCADQDVVFTLDATIPQGEVKPDYEWFFGDSDTSVYLPSPAAHRYAKSDTFRLLARAYSLEGCFGEIQRDIILKPTPLADFSITDHCLSRSMPLTNQTILEGDSAVYFWDFGDGSNSTEKNPSKLFGNLGTFEVSLIVQSAGSQCSDTLSRSITVNPLPGLSTNIDTAYFENEGFVSLEGTPPGGNFFGNGVFGNLFNTDYVGTGLTSISYTYEIAETGCSDTISQFVNVKEFNQPPSILFTNPPKTICAGRPVSLLVQATGTRLKFQWYRNGQLSPNDTLPILNFNPTFAGNSGNYSLRIWNILDTIETNLIPLQVNPVYSRIDSIVICPNSSYQLPNGQLVTNPGIYLSQFQTIAGCDSSVTTILDTSSLIRRNFTATICNGTQFDFYEQTLNQAGTYSHTVVTGNGCDSLYVLNLNVLFPDTIEQSIGSCQSINWYGQQIESSGIYYASISSGQGVCDSTFKLIFSRLNPPDTSITVLSNCGPFNWNNNQITESGVYFFNTINPQGCDSVARLDISIFPLPDTSVTNASSCGPYIWNNLVYLVSGTYYLSFPLPNGCDSIARLNVNISPIEDTSFVSVSSCGSYVWNNQFIQSSGTYYFNTLTSGGCDSVARLDLVIFPSPDTLYQQQISCGPYIWNGTVFTSSGTYFYSGQNANGCDSVAVLSLQVLPAPDTSTTSIQNCGPYTWNGSVYAISGTFFKNFEIPGLCDSVARLDLTIYPVETTDTVRSCGSYFWSGSFRDTSGLYQFTSPNVLGCDSTAYLRLTIFPVPDTSNTEIQSCGPFFWNGETYFNSGNFYFNSLNENGCDSVARLQLVVVNPPKDSVLVDSSCGSYVWNNQEYSQSGTYSIVTPLPNGCDSTSILILTVFPTSSSELATSCGPYNWNGQIISESGIYSRTFTNILGCDSIVTLNLTVYSKPDTSLSFVENCGPYFWNGILRSSSGTYYFDIQNFNGCDSTAVLQLVLLPQPDTVNVVDSACGSYTWKNQIITESGIYLFITPGPAGGCDTVSRLYVTIFPNSSNEFVTACSEFVWNNQAYTESGIYTYTTISSKGCDSTAILQLTIISPPEPVYLEFTRCLPFLWNNQLFDTSGVYQVNVDLPGICDSVYFLTITETTPPDTSVNTVTSCGPYFWNGALRDSSGVYYYSILNGNGCDSTARLELIVLPAAQIVQDPVSLGFTEGNNLTMSVVTIPASGSGAVLQWQVDDGNGFVNIASSDPFYQGHDSITLVILNVPISYDGYRYRCIVTNGTCSDTSGFALISGLGDLFTTRPGIIIQPNPAKMQTYIKADARLDGSIFRLYDLHGILLRSGTLKGALTLLNLRGLPPGLYHLRVESEITGYRSVQKVLVE